MLRVDKTVFISYRRTNAPWALAIFQSLKQEGYDVFFDFNGIASGDFERVILETIKARAHFVVLLTPSALERCGDQEDWLRREIETALEFKRNIVPVMLEGFDFASPGITGQLTGRLAALKSYNALRVPVEYFDEAMSRLRNRYLNVPLEAVLHPVSSAAKQAAKDQQASANTAPVVKGKDLTAQEYFEKGHASAIAEEKIRLYSEALRLKPDYVEAFNNRGVAKFESGDLDGAIQDYSAALRLQPDYSLALHNRGLIRKAKGDFAGALQDYNNALRVKPDYASAYNSRGALRHDQGDFEGAIKDYTEAIRLDPQNPDNLHNRGLSRKAKGDLAGAMQDYDSAIRVKPGYATAFSSRGALRRSQGDLEGALKDYDDAIRLKPDYPDALNNRGLARKAKGDLDGALQDYNEAIRLKPDYTEGFNSRGALRFAKNDMEGALLDYNESLRLNPKYAPPYCNRAIVLQGKNQYKEAVADYQKYLDLGGGALYGNQAEIENVIRSLQAKL